MTFLHKLSQRLARLKTRPLSAVAAVSAAAAIVGCELPSATSEPTPTVIQVVVSPQAVTVLQGELQDFVAVGYTATGDTAPVSVTWSTTGGSLADKGTRGGRHYGQYKNTQCGGSTVTATAQPGNVSGRASVTVLCPATVGAVVAA